MAPASLRDLALNTATSLDHVGLVAPAARPLHDAFERLGFVLTPLSRQSGRLRADGPVEPWGTANRCAMLRQGYIELLAIIDPALPANGLDRFLARHAGMHILALGIDDEIANLERLRRAGLDIPGVLHLERAVDDADPDGPRARFARLPIPDAPEGRLQLVRHLTPEAIRQERFLRHPNAAVALETAVLAVADPAATAARLSRLAGRPVTPDPAGGFQLELPAAAQEPSPAGGRGQGEGGATRPKLRPGGPDHPHPNPLPPAGEGACGQPSSVRILPPEALGSVFPGLTAPTLPFMAGFVIRTSDSARSVRALAPGLREVPGGWLALAGGAAIVFR